MIKDGKPYTCEEGHEDFDLLSDGDTMGKISKEEFQNEVLDWIDEFVSPAKRKYKGTSYSLKHMVEKWYGNLYITNNQMKDAMMQKGYMPIDPNALNWEYRIKITKENWGIDELQKLYLLPDQNEVLKNFIFRKFPGITIHKKDHRTNSHYFIDIEAYWHISVTKKQVVIKIYRYNSSVRQEEQIRLAYLKKRRVDA